ncbi:hypothetical protein AB6V46_16840, partial [Stenotrophomonas maltophilia]|uniref:hypothetical protein n=1 Tax=Stenotrophomonas maltophilia TaxID=40324 RepID=UPI0034E2B41B
FLFGVIRAGFGGFGADFVYASAVKPAFLMGLTCGVWGVFFFFFFLKILGGVWGGFLGFFFLYGVGFLFLGGVCYLWGPP